MNCSVRSGLEKNDGTIILRVSECFKEILHSSKIRRAYFKNVIKNRPGGGRHIAQ